MLTPNPNLKINLSNSSFKDFINRSNLYIDKTRFIENILTESYSVLLFTRPGRTGKSLNIDALRIFLDCKQDTVHLFKGLYIENSNTLALANKYPVIKGKSSQWA